MRPLLVAASVWPAAPPRHHVLVAAADVDGRAVWTGADDGGIVRWVLQQKQKKNGNKNAKSSPQAPPSSSPQECDEAEDTTAPPAGASAFLAGHTKRVTALVACPGDATAAPSMVSGGEDGVVCVWSADVGMCVARRAMMPTTASVGTMGVGGAGGGATAAAAAAAVVADGCAARSSTRHRVKPQLVHFKPLTTYVRPYTPRVHLSYALSRRGRCNYKVSDLTTRGVCGSDVDGGEVVVVRGASSQTSKPIYNNCARWCDGSLDDDLAAR